MKRLIIYAITWGLFWTTLDLMENVGNRWGSWQFYLTVVMMALAFQLREWFGGESQQP